MVNKYTNFHEIWLTWSGFIAFFISVIENFRMRAIAHQCTNNLGYLIFDQSNEIFTSYCLSINLQAHQFSDNFMQNRMCSDQMKLHSFPNLCGFSSLP